ncbi:hypothetical protein C8A03DRAFT_40136 [Achaetomium macrosporum]|uniref:CN hydrolase domain-containing protein n=1 Tax=Achaetomium macrosporum TaxID=79813 RepID=A0AAN7CI30_9PEZI|nr:hypothetical protein C8A03DRAFT_40136 [Achaetomium macrosporum]
MRIGCLQFAPQVGDVPGNITRAEAVFSRADPQDLENLDLLVLPEMALSGTDGEKLANYRKSFLYYTDATWAHEGQGFYGGKLGNFGQVAMGICRRSPYKFEAPWDAYEFGFHILRARANLVIMSMAWLTNDERTVFTSRPDAPDFSTLTYWVRRLEPVIQAGSPEETIVVFANRCGTEDEATYAGTSTVLGIKDGEVSVYGILGRGVEELLVVDTDKPPFAKLIDPSEAASLQTTRKKRSPRKTQTQGQVPGRRTRRLCPPQQQQQPPAPSQQGRRSTAIQPGTTTTTSLSLLPASPPAEHSSSQAYARGLRDRLPSAIPIFVDVYTPDEPVWPSDEHEHQHEHYRHGLGATEEVRFGADALLTPSPTASSPLGRLSRGRTRITVAASPSVWGRAVAF